MRVTKILIADDQPIIAEGIKGLLGPSFDVVGIAADSQLLFEMVQQFDPEIVVLEISRPQLGGLQVIKQLRNMDCRAKLIVFTFYADPVDAVRAMNLGASGFLLKSSSADELLVAFDGVLAGHTYISTGLSQESSAMLAVGSDHHDIEQSLTPRQRDVLRLFATGYSAKEVGGILSISRRTAENHKAEIKRLLGVKSNAELVRLALQLGLVSPHNSTLGFNGLRGK